MAFFSSFSGSFSAGRKPKISKFQTYQFNVTVNNFSYYSFSGDVQGNNPIINCQSGIPYFLI